METVDLINSWSAQTAVELLAVILAQTIVVLIAGKLVPSLCDRFILAVNLEGYEELGENFLEPNKALITWIGTLILGHFFIFNGTDISLDGSSQGLWVAMGLSRLLHFVIYHGLVVCISLLLAQVFSLWLGGAGKAVAGRFGFDQQPDLKLVEMTGHFVIGLLAVTVLSQRYIEFGFLFFVLLVIGGITARDAVSNLFSAWLIRWDQSIEVGDQVRIPGIAGKAEVTGVVEAIGWGTTRIRTENSEKTTEVPNRELQNLRYVVKREQPEAAIVDKPVLTDSQQGDDWG